MSDCKGGFGRFCCNFSDIVILFSGMRGIGKMFYSASLFLEKKRDCDFYFS